MAHAANNSHMPTQTNTVIKSRLFIADFDLKFHPHSTHNGIDVFVVGNFVAVGRIIFVGIITIQHSGVYEEKTNQRVPPAVLPEYTEQVETVPYDDNWPGYDEPVFDF